MADRAAIKNLILYFGIGVFAIVAFNSYLFFKRPSAAITDAGLVTEVRSHSGPATTSGDRNPASIEQVKVAEAVLAVPCGANHEFAEVSQNQVQLKFEKCKGYLVKSITNKKNGSSAMVFSVGDYDFVTDLVQIEPGLNEIEVVSTNNTGTKVSLIKIPKTIPAKSGD